MKLNALTNSKMSLAAACAIFSVFSSLSAGAEIVAANACSVIFDSTAPTISINGEATITIEAGTGYSDAGVTATDNISGDVTGRVVVTGSVNAATPGKYTLTFVVVDDAGNQSESITRTIVVADTTKPIITLLGSADVTIEALSTYTDAGATAADNIDGDITVRISTENNVNASKIGTYTVTYNVSDAAGNAAVTVVRNVKVVDTTPPVITIKDPTN